MSAQGWCTRHGTVPGLAPRMPGQIHGARYYGERAPLLLTTRGGPPEVRDFAGELVDAKRAAVVLAQVCAEWAAIEAEALAGRQGVLL